MIGTAFARRKRPFGVRRAALVGGLLGIAAVVALLLMPVAAGGTSSSGGLSGYVVATNQGPLPLGSGSASTVWHFIHVVNGNSLTDENGGTDRTTVPHSFVVSSVDEAIYVDGSLYSSLTFAPPPNIAPDFLPRYSGHWPATVRCSGAPPCTDVINPAVLPGEDTVALYTGWVHGEGEPNGSYVFRYTVHGTLNGVATDVVAVSPKISMTSQLQTARRTDTRLGSPRSVMAYKSTGASSRRPG